MTRVMFQDARGGIGAAVQKLFEPFGGGKKLLKSSGNVFLKINGIDFKPHVYTSPEVVGALVRYFYDQGARRVYVMENSTQGNITRLVFEITGMKQMCRQTGAIPLYLDETGEMPLYLPGLQAFVSIPDNIHENLIRNRAENLYLSVPKLKTHSMTTVTLGIKNQFGLLHQASRIPDHNFKLHRKIADIFFNIQPDFTVVDGLEAVNFGHYPAQALAERSVRKLDLLFGGDDPLAVDVVGARLLGFDLDEVAHLKEAAAYGLGESRFDRIEILNKALFEERRQQFSWNLLELFPKDVTLLYGKTRCCTEGCKRNTEAVLEVFGQDFSGKGGFTVIMGKDADPEIVRRIKGPVHLAGDCAISDHFQDLSGRLGRKNVTKSAGCNNLAATVDGLAKWMKIPPLRLVPIHPLKSLGILMQAKWYGSRANIPPVLRW